MNSIDVCLKALLGIPQVYGVNPFGMTIGGNAGAKPMAAARAIGQEVERKKNEGFLGCKA